MQQRSECSVSERKAGWQLLGRKNYLKAAEISMKDDFGMIDGIINNGPKEDKTLSAASMTASRAFGRISSPVRAFPGRLRKVNN